MPENILPGIHTLIFILLHRNHPSLPASQAIVMPVFFPRAARFLPLRAVYLSHILMTPGER
ncbi:hypothetical protein [Klebsiella quasipneumoniae]|uniref:hypothetical protein n=1 Tax=Klebsiella quasipneumoniae TaxID=1463165 RepID=UPI000A7DFE7F|nr:hypothetical protein [Klebsiella quasipneumoniae]